MLRLFVLLLGIFGLISCRRGVACGSWLVALPFAGFGLPRFVI